MNAHLTRNQLFALLENPGTPSQTAFSSEVGSAEAHLKLSGAPSQTALSSEVGSAESHLATCAFCHAEFATLRDSLANFRIAATNLSALYTPTRLLERNPARARFFTVPRAAWATGLVAAMALCTASISVLHKPAVPAAPTAQVQPAADSDDALLEGIDTDLSTSVAPSLQPLDVPAATNKTSAKTPVSGN